MEIEITPNSRTTLSFSNREQRNQNQGNFESSVAKKVRLTPVSYAMSGSTGDVLIRCSAPDYIREYVQSNTSLIDGVYNPSYMPQELKELLDVSFLHKVGGIHFEEDMTGDEYIRRGGDISALL